MTGLLAKTVYLTKWQGIGVLGIVVVVFLSFFFFAVFGSRWAKEQGNDRLTIHMMVCAVFFLTSALAALIFAIFVLFRSA